MNAPDVHAPFRFADLAQLRRAVDELGLDIPTDEDTSPLRRPVEVGGCLVPNAMAVQPMEGCDGRPDGAPDELTFRRYRRFAAGGAGLLWFEACAVAEEGRANPRQLWIRRETQDEFARLLRESRQAAADSMGSGHRPLCVLQLTHSGRYSRPSRDPRPVIAHHDPVLDADRGIPPDYPLITDDELEELEERYVDAARLAFEVGFDAVDIKACHRYLMNELLAAHTRGGRYGGSYENRTRLLKNVARRVLDLARIVDDPHHLTAGGGRGRIVTCRLGIFDAHPYPHGWGVDHAEPVRPNLEEPKRLVRELLEMGVPMVNITMGNPYFNPHVNRPYDRPVEGGTVPDEHPLVGVARLIGLTREIKRAVPGMIVVGSGYSWLRNLWPNVAAANLRDKAMDVVGLGRQAFAYPDFAKEILETGRLERRHTCIACSSCTQIMRDGGRTGCVPFDREVYGPIYREGRRGSLDRVKAMAARCRDCFDPTCVDGCPAGVDIPGFLKALADGDIRESYNVLRKKNALPEMCGLVCPAEVQCEGECIENVFSREPVPIRELQRYVSRVAREKGWTRTDRAAGHSGKRVAVIGAGPAGLACAVRLRELGHSAEVFDLRESPGGVAAWAIPERRLPAGDSAAEIEAVLEGLDAEGISLRVGEGLTAATTLDHYASEFDAVVLAMGLGCSPSLTEFRPGGVEDAVAFLTRAKKEGAGVPDRVAVLGGGNTAMDAATTAAACGARDVYLVYRRSFAEMPAWPAERDEALAVGVHFLLLTQPIDYVVDEGGRLTGVRIARTVLGEPDSSGRRRPEIVPGSESILEADMALEALGQQLDEGVQALLPGVELTAGRLVAVDERQATTRKGVFAAGDITNGGATAVRAIAEGMRAAEAVDEYLGTSSKGG